MRMIRFLFLSLIFLFPLALSAQSIAGAWMMTVPTDDGGTSMIKLMIKDNGTFTVDFGNDGSVDINGQYETSGDQITVVELDGDGASCKGVKGVYQFTVDASNFVMTRVSDSCESRGGPEGKMVFKKA